LPANSDVDKHGPPARPFMTDAYGQSAVRPDAYYGLAPSDVSKHWPHLTSSTTDIARQQLPARPLYSDTGSEYSSPLPEVYSSLPTTTTGSYEYTSLSVDSLIASHARPTVSLGPRVDDAC